MSDTNKDLLDGIKSVGDKIEASKEETKNQLAEFKKATDAKISEAEKLIAEVRAADEARAKELNEDLIKKGASLKEIAEAIEKLEKKQGKLSASGGVNHKTALDAINETFADNHADIQGFKAGGNKSYEIKGNITIGNVTNLSGSFVNLPQQYDTSIFDRPTRKVQIRDLVPVINTTANSFVYYRQPVTGAIGTGSFGFQAGQGNTKAALDYNLQPVVVTPDYLAGTARISKQMLNDLASMQSFLSGQLIEDYRRAESQSFIPTLVASATAFTPNPATTVTAEKIIQSIGDLLGKDWDPNGIVTDALTWAKILNTKPQNYSLPGGGNALTVDASGNIRFVGMPFVIQNNMPASQIIVGDFTKAAIVQNEGLSVGFYEQDQDNVVKNLITARVEARVAFTVMRPDAFDFFGAGTT